ncbi:MAG: alpha/beta hydrolase [Acidobacteriaceae bacterium]
MKSLLTVALLLTTSALAQTPMPVIPPTGHVHTPDVDLAYWVYGASQSTTPIFAVNGGPGLSHIYMVQNDVWQRIAQRRQVIFYDQRGDGASPLTNPSAPQTMDAQVADLDAIRSHLHLDKIDLCGDSFGGLLVIAYAAAHPDHVHQLIISDGLPSWSSIVHLFPQVFPDRLEAQATAAKASTASAEVQAQQSLRDHFAMIFYSPEKLAHYMANAPDLGFSPTTAAAVGAATAHLDYNTALAKFTFPTLVINGRYDMNVAPLTAYRMYKAIPNAKLVIFEKSGHLPSYEEPDKYVQVLNNFLTN